jgi:hypothetical protein
MDRPEAIERMRQTCNQLSAGITSLHPLVPHLADKPTEDEVFKALFALTKEVESVKKQLLRLERRDDSQLL